MIKTLFFFTLLACTQACSTHTALANEYQLEYSAQFSAKTDKAIAVIHLRQREGQIKEIDFNMPSDVYEVIDADGEIKVTDARVEWTPPKRGGKISYRYTITQPKGQAYDALHTKNWLVLRLGDLFPAGSVRSLPKAQPRATLRMQGPQDWSFESPYGDVTEQSKAIDGNRKYLRPTGWLVGGKIGTRRDAIAGRLVTLAAPDNSGFRRLDTLAFLNWTLPEVAKTFPTLPKKLLVVGAPEPMWRGGLSGPNSLYIHVTRPLVSENSTSPMIR